MERSEIPGKIFVKSAGRHYFILSNLRHSDCIGT